MKYYNGWIKRHEKEYYELLAFQNYGCGICGVENKPLVLDHWHENGEIRGLLCNGCNVYLGAFIDKLGVDYFFLALSYITKPPARILEDGFEMDEEDHPKRFGYGVNFG